MVVGLHDYIARLQNLEKNTGDIPLLVFDRILTEVQAYKLEFEKFNHVQSAIADILAHLPD